ncbi:hypothetical protein H5V43_00695 [Sphingobium fuliginis]|jgi:type II secretory pathway pseudopilin PulG|uniref:Uncharacterized protein n=1 Tax=Sphingobium fuliginis (strain ATCC 27551) TaxID=336203 RepID=A0A7M2GG79_SPHSA|nr:hypothetical protein [Sphingobium fuliginis]QOT71736.1 hypothetical protein H5V43_00695 [Sphingobium fuliginis]
MSWTTALGLARRLWWAPVIIGLVVALALTSMKVDVRTAERDKARTDLSAEQQARKQTVANYRAASAEALRQAAENVKRVKAEQATITERKINDLQAHYAAVDARYERVRVQLAARTDLRSSDPAPVSIASEATCRAYGGTSCDGLLAKLRIAERQAWNLIELREWVRQQAAVDVTPASEAAD